MTKFFFQTLKQNTEPVGDEGDEECKSKESVGTQTPGKCIRPPKIHSNADHDRHSHSKVKFCTLLGEIFFFLEKKNIKADMFCRFLFLAKLKPLPVIHQNLLADSIIIPIRIAIHIAITAMLLLHIEPLIKRISRRILVDRVIPVLGLH